MGKGKGSFDHWAARIAVNQIIFEIKGLAHEKVILDALRLAGNKLPGKIPLKHVPGRGDGSINSFFLLYRSL